MKWQTLKRQSVGKEPLKTKSSGQRSGYSVDLWDLCRTQKMKNSGREIPFSLGPSVVTVLITTVCLVLSVPAKAEISQSQAIRAIVGEAEDQGLTGMTAVAEALRNRGHLKGVYGVNSPRLKKAPKWVFVMASKAWKDSEKSSLVKGASFWESTDFKTPYWSKGMVQTAHIGKHKFYREVVK